MHDLGTFLYFFPDLHLYGDTITYTTDCVLCICVCACEDKNKDSIDESTSQGMPGIARNHQKLNEERGFFSKSLQRENAHAATLISNFWLPDYVFVVLFPAAKFMVLCYRSSRQLTQEVCQRSTDI